MKLKIFKLLVRVFLATRKFCLWVSDKRHDLQVLQLKEVQRLLETGKASYEYDEEKKCFVLKMKE